MTTTTSERKPIAFRANGLAAILDYALASHARAAALLVVAALLAFLPGFFQIPPVDRDEAHFTQATKQMLESGEYVDIRFQEEVRYKKPIGIYWLQAGAVKAGEALGVPGARTTIWLYRLPSLIGATGAVLLTYWAALAFVSRRAALLAALMMATSILLGVEARLAKTDAMLLLTVVAAMGAMARAYLADRVAARSWRDDWMLCVIFWVTISAGVLIKGPLIVLFVGLPALVLAVADRSLRWVLRLKPAVGMLIFAVLVLPWFIAIFGRAGELFFAGSVGKDTLPKIWSSQEGHGAPPGMYFVMFWLTFWPGATLAGMAAPSVWAARREKGARFLLAWVLPSWIVFELVVTKLPHYVLPLYPAIAILIAGVVDPHLLGRERWMTRGLVWWFVVPVLIGVATISILVVFAHQFGLLAWPFGAASAIFGLWAWRLFPADGAERSLMRAMLASILLVVAVYGVLVPALTPAFPSAEIARLLREGDCADPQLASAGYSEPSLVFLAGTGTRMVDGIGAADFLHRGGCRYVAVEQRSERGFLRRAETIGLRYSPPQRIDGFNYSTGHSVSINLYRSEETP
jgi:4-amino-4-deoxy-L-arabinose transferase-like glycosyltransferase